jgi:hypothetical protein
MKRYFLFIFIFLSTFISFAQGQERAEKPKIVVGIVIDQMRWDYLYRFSEHYGSNGFARLMREGFNCQNTMINYIPTNTAPGHSCIYTGSVPSIHGIAANDWVNNLTGKKTYCVFDDSVRIIVNGDTVNGRGMSPKNLLVSTITDELRLASNFHSRVYGVAIKDRGSIIPAGHLANGAYWFDDTTGNFCSSTYYTKHNSPNWLKKFNSRHLADSLVALNWNLLDKTGAIYTQSTKDSNLYEGLFKGETEPVFPHTFGTLSGVDKYNAFKFTPGGNTITLELAKACMEGTHLGKGDYTDFLCVSLSSTDYAGHMFGPNSMEIEDSYIRLDKEIATFLSYMDANYGKGNYLLFLTADHGAAHNPKFLTDNNIPAGILDQKIKAGLNDYLKNIHGYDSLVSFFTNNQFYINEGVITFYELDRAKIKESIMHWLNRRADLAYVIDMENIDRTPLPEPVRTMVINGFHRVRSGGYQVIPNPGWFDTNSKTGTTHGAWNPYDAHIPLLWYGWNIPKGETHTIVNMTDISATLAALLHIQMPNGCIGKPISDIVK